MKPRIRKGDIMNEMTTEQAVQNLDNLIAVTRMNRQEHVGMQQSLELLKRKAVQRDVELDSAEVDAEEAEKEVE